MTTAEIIKIQTFLKNNGYTDSKGNPIVADGNMGPLTKSAIMKYQTKLGVTPDGDWGPKTETAHQTVLSGGSTSETSTTSGPFNSATGVSTELEKKMPTTYYDYQKNADLEKPQLQQEMATEDLAEAVGIDENFIKNYITNKPDVVGFYVNALTYGGYTVGDVLNDMKRREMMFNKDPNALKMKAIISDSMDKEAYMMTAEGKQSASDTKSYIPTFNFAGSFNPAVLNYGRNMPDEIFNEFVPVIDKDSQDFKDKVAEVKQAFAYLTDAQIKATSEQEKAAADYNYNQFKDQLEKTYGVALSNDASKAWAQIEALEESYSKRGIQGSGLENEEVDTTLTEARKQDQQIRQEKLTKEEAQKAAFYAASATPAQIAALTPEERQKYGLAPSAEEANMLSMATLREKFPDMSEADLKDYRSTILDENGNYRSAIYAKRFLAIYNNKVSAKDKAETEVYETALAKENTVGSNYDKSQPYSATDRTGEEELKSAIKENGEVATDPAKDTPLVPSETNTSTISGNLRMGSTDVEGIKKLQTTLNSLNKDTPGWIPLVVDGKFGTKTDTAVKAYQTTNKLASDGIVGKQTSSSLNTYTAPIIKPVVNQPVVNQPVVKPVVNQPVVNNPAPIVPKVTTPTVTTPAKTGYQGSSIVDYLSSTGQDSSYAARKKLYGGTTYSGSSSENTELLKRLRGY